MLINDVNKWTASETTDDGTSSSGAHTLETFTLLSDWHCLCNGHIHHCHCVCAEYTPSERQTAPGVCRGASDDFLFFIEWLFQRLKVLSIYSNWRKKDAKRAPSQVQNLLFPFVKEYVTILIFWLYCKLIWDNCQLRSAPQYQNGMVNTIWKPLITVFTQVRGNRHTIELCPDRQQQIWRQLILILNPNGDITLCATKD